MKLYSYVLRDDSGFAPNPFWNYSTLACCKPIIRKRAELGDWIVGSGSMNNMGNNKLIYAMKVTDKLTFEQYAKDKRFENKIPSNGLREERGDNIYSKNDKGEWVQRPSYHSKRHQEHDLKGEYVLISDHFYYFGRNAISIQEELKQIIKKGPGHKSKSISKKDIEKFEEWIEKQPQGIQGEPHEFEQKSPKRKKGKC
ncbi:hypothetical protein C5S31_00805 [ANME-1 cluster archaeon GoMg2]|nr:hypothetical protein [ANME-1 cluster archaeon GoMg2]